MNKWDERYSEEEYRFGRTPNAFLESMAHQIPKGRVLCLGAGEGRNAVYLAGLGHEVTAIDASEVGLRKAEKLATENGVSIKTIVCDLEDYSIAAAHWQGITSIFCHLPSPLRKRLNEEIVGGLIPGGIFIQEAYTPKQLQYGTGGPPDVELLMELDVLKQELQGLDFVHAQELDRDVVEGNLHTGKAAVVQIVAKREVSAPLN